MFRLSVIPFSKDGRACPCEHQQCWSRHQDELSVSAFKGYPSSSFVSRNYGTLRRHYPHNYHLDLGQQYEKPPPSTKAGKEKKMQCYPRNLDSNSQIIPGSPGSFKNRYIFLEPTRDSDFNETGLKLNQ